MMIILHFDDEDNVGWKQILVGVQCGSRTQQTDYVPAAPYLQTISSSFVSNMLILKQLPVHGQWEVRGWLHRLLQACREQERRNLQCLCPHCQEVSRLIYICLTMWLNCCCRWKKLPRNTGKNWAHVVDARTGPGTKNIFKQKKKESPVPFEKPYKYKHVYKRKPLKTKKREEEEEHQVLGHMSSTRPAWGSTYCSTPEFLDNSYWRRQTMCCGVVYLGRLGEAMLDQRLYQPCTKSGKHDLTLSPLEEHPASLQPSPSSSAFSSSLTPSSIESLVEAELQAFQVFDSFIICSRPETQPIKV